MREHRGRSLLRGPLDRDALDLPAGLPVDPLRASLYTASEPRLIMSTDPVLIDSIMLERINAVRKRNGFDPVTDDDARMLDFAQQLGVGSMDTKNIKWRKLSGDGK